MLNNIKDICQSQGGLDPPLSTHFRLNSAEGGGEKVFVNSCSGFLDQFSQWESDVQQEEAGSMTTAEASEAARRSGGRARAPACCHRVTPRPPATISLLSVSRQQSPYLGTDSKRSNPSSQGQSACLDHPPHLSEHSAHTGTSDVSWGLKGPSWLRPLSASENSKCIFHHLWYHNTHQSSPASVAQT